MFKAEASAWTPAAVQVQQVWVDPTLRGRGYGARGMRDLCRLLLERTPIVTLFVRTREPPRDRALRVDRDAARRPLPLAAVLSVERAILARHGESMFNVLELMNGDIELPGGLTPIGHEQAAALGEALRGERIDLCVTSEFERARTTADEALAGRQVPRAVCPALNDPLYGRYEGKRLEAYRAWAWANPATESPGEGGESRVAIVARYARAFRGLLARPEETILVVAHSLPIAYALAAREGQAPGARVPLVGNAVPYPFSACELEAVASLLEQWVAAPGW